MEEAITLGTDDEVCQKIAQAIEELSKKGTTAEEIAKALEEDGCKTPTNFVFTCFCPVGKWIWHRIPWKYEKGFNFGVGAMEVTYSSLSSVALPNHISDFIKRFDKGEFSFLRDSSTPLLSD